MLALDHHARGAEQGRSYHPEDEIITVLTGSWALGMGSRVNMDELQPMEQGSLGFVPKKMAHFDTQKSKPCFRFTGAARS